MVLAATGMDNAITTATINTAIMLFSHSLFLLTLL